MKCVLSKCLCTSAALLAILAPLLSAPHAVWAHDDSDDAPTKTPIKHVVIFQENVSFDHYFATYPHAGSLFGMFDFDGRQHRDHDSKLTLDPISGRIVSGDSDPE